MKFNHESKTITGAFNINMSSEQIAETLTEIVRQWVLSDDADKVSHLAERMHEQLPYELILFLATQEVHGKIRSTLTDLDGMIRDVIKKVAQDEEDKKAKMN